MSYPRLIPLLLLTVVAVGRAPALPEKRLFVSPDRFELEVESYRPVLRLTASRFGPVASFTLVPGYDVALSAIGYAHRETNADVETIRLPIEVTDFELTSRFAARSPAVRAVEKDLGHDRLTVRIYFSEDITPDQAQWMMSAYRVYGSVKGKIANAPGVPPSLRGSAIEAVPAFNQFQETGERELRGLRVDYAALVHYREHQKVHFGARIAEGADLDSLVRAVLMTDTKPRYRCLEELARHDKWLCNLILDQSFDGSLNEAIFAFAKKVFPAKTLDDGPSRYVYDLLGRPLKTKALSSELAELPAGRTEIERLLAERDWTKPDEAGHREKMWRYVMTLYQFYLGRKLQAAHDFLSGIRAIEETSPRTEVLMAIAFAVVERRSSPEQSVQSTLAAIQFGKVVNTKIQVLLRKLPLLSESVAAATMQEYFEANFRSWSSDDKARAIKALRENGTLHGDKELNARMLRRIFLEIETATAPLAAPEKK